MMTLLDAVPKHQLFVFLYRGFERCWSNDSSLIPVSDIVGWFRVSEEEVLQKLTQSGTVVEVALSGF